MGSVFCLFKFTTDNQTKVLRPLFLTVVLCVRVVTTSGILKQVKDHIRECTHCQSRRGSDDGTGQRLFSRPAKRRGAANTNEEEDEDEEDDEADDSLFLANSSAQLRSKLSKTTAKHELVFVCSNDMLCSLDNDKGLRLLVLQLSSCHIFLCFQVDSKGEVNQFLSEHSQTMLEKLNSQRLSNQFCDITLLIEGEEYRAHKAVLAACSEYFHNLFFEKGAASTHEAVVDLSGETCFMLGSPQNGKLSCSILTPFPLPSGFTKASFLPLLDFAYTSMLTFNFCIMADIANLARHLLMSEVLQICEFVHKQVEEQKLKVYQKGDVHTVSSQTTPNEGLKGESGAYVVTLQGDGSAVVTQSADTITGEPLAFVAAPEETYVQQSMIVAAPVAAGAVEEDKEHHVEAGQKETVTLIAHSGEAKPGETVTLISGSAEGMEGETMTVVTHSGQAGAQESLAMVSACLAMEQPQVTEAAAFIINVEPDKESQPEVVSVASATVSEAVTVPQETAESAPIPQKRKRGRPAKVKKEVEQKECMPLEEEEEPSADESHGDKQEPMSDDPNKRRLRQRHIAEGGYARLHMGLEDEEEGKKGSAPPRVTTPKVHLYI